MSYWDTIPGMVRAAGRLVGTGGSSRSFSPSAIGGRSSGGGITISNVTKTFFRPELIRDPILKARNRVISRFGMFVMKDARQSLRHRKNASKAGRPPTSWNSKLNSSHNDLLKRFIFYSYETPSKVVIGPVNLDGPISKLRIPAVLEYGGQLPNKDRHGSPIMSTISPRPYMRPAFDRQIAKRMPLDFEGSIRG